MSRHLDVSQIVTKLIPVDAIADHPDNYNKHPDEQIEQLAASHAQFGQYRSIVVWERPGGKYIRVVGHGYSAGAKREGETMLRAEVLPIDTPAETVKAIMIADNLHAQNSAPDEVQLVLLLQEQQDAGFDLRSLGTDDESLRQMLEAMGDGYLGGGEREEGEGGDEFDVTPQEGPTRTHVGELWQLGEHRLLVGDCLDTQAMKILLKGEKVQAIVSDPPYGMRLDTSYSFSKGNEEMAIKPTKGYAKVVGDDRDFDASYFFKAFPDVKEMFLFGADYYVDTLPNYGKGGSWMVWDKKNEALRNVLGLADFELIWSMQRHKRRVYAILWNGALGTESEDTKRRVHPTQKPIRLLEAIMGEYIKPDMLVADPFLGSGATLITCENLGYRCVGAEIEPQYADVIIRRFESHTGQTATLLERVEVAK